MVFGSSLRSLLILGILFSISSCGKPIKEDKSADVIGQLPFGEEIAVDYIIEDQECLQNGEGISDVSDVPVHVWQNGMPSSINFGFGDVTSVNSLSGKLTHTTYYGYHQQNDCEYSSSTGLVCGKGGNVIATPKKLRVCDKNRTYSRNSIEGVGLASINNLEKAHRFYSGIEGHSEDMKKSSLLVLPTVEKLYDVTDSTGKIEKKKRVTTDNLAYAPSFIGSPTFVIFPKGKKALEKGLWRNINLWEVPWTLAHEYGHHVFRTHTGISNIESGYALPEIHLFNPEENEVGFDLTARTVSLKEKWGAVNESFADLYAFYALGGQSGQLSEIDCFTKNREVDSSTFLNGRVKALDASALSEFDATYRRSRSSCSDPVFQDIHVVGAVIAYGVDQLFTIKAGNDPRDKAELLLKWADSLARTLSSSNQSLSIPGLLKPMLEIVSIDGRNLTSEQCNVLTNVFPQYKREWLSEGQISCQ